MNHGTWINREIGQDIDNTYWTPFFIREQESHLLQMAHICVYNLNSLFNQGRCDYFECIKDAFCKYGTKTGKKVAIKVFPNEGEKRTIFKCEDFEVAYWNYNKQDLRSEEEIEKMKSFIW